MVELLEAQCSLRPDSADGVYREGDIIVIALAGHPWGSGDRKEFVIVQWPDDRIEQQLVERVKVGEQWPVAAHPYAVIEPVKNTPRNKIAFLLKQRSVHAVDVRELSESRAVPVFDKTATKQTVAAGDYAVRADTVATTDGIITKTVKAVWNAVTSLWDWMTG